MARGYTTRKLEVYSLHCRSEEKKIDYEEIFSALASLKARERVLGLGGRVLALPRFEYSKKRAWLAAIEGDSGVSPLIFDADAATERVEVLGDSEVVANKTHAAIDLGSRQAVVEYNHRGAKAAEIARTLEDLGQAALGIDDLAVELNPVADEEFAKALARFERIRVASLKVARPNIDWTEHYNNLSRVAEESNARTMEVTFTAGRRASLKASSGVIRYIRDLALSATSALKGARVTGTRSEETAETSLSLAHHIEHQRINVKMTPDGHVEEKDVREKIEAFLDSRAKKVKDNA